MRSSLRGNVDFELINGRNLRGYVLDLSSDPGQYSQHFLRFIGREGRRLLREYWAEAAKERR